MKYLLLILAFLAAPAFAQQAQRPPTSLEQAEMAKLNETLSAEINFRTQLIDAQNQIRQLQDELNAAKASAKAAADELNKKAAPAPSPSPSPAPTPSPTASPPSK
jgi:hypothetical protein